MIALFDGGMMDAAWPVAETPASSNPANPIAMADFCTAQFPPWRRPRPSSGNNDARGRSVQVGSFTARGQAALASIRVVARVPPRPLSYSAGCSLIWP